jgi:hypothetical protein
MPYWADDLKVKTVEKISPEQIEKYISAVCDELNTLGDNMFGGYGFTYSIHEMKESKRTWGEAFYHGDWEVSFFDTGEDNKEYRVTMENVIDAIPKLLGVAPEGNCRYMRHCGSRVDMVEYLKQDFGGAFDPDMCTADWIWQVVVFGGYTYA